MDESHGKEYATREAVHKRQSRLILATSRHKSGNEAKVHHKEVDEEDQYFGILQLDSCKWFSVAMSVIVVTMGIMSMIVMCIHVI